MTNQIDNHGKNYSLESLTAWIDIAGTKGLMNKNTAIVKKAAVIEVLVNSGILEEFEKQDMRQINTEEIFTRYMHSHPHKHRQETLKSYRSRLKSVVDAFIRYTDNPLTFSASPPKAKIAKKAKAPKPASKSTQSALIQQTSNVESQQNQRITTPLPVLISDGNTITIQNFPLNITEEEADAICSVINGFVKKSAKNDGRKLIEKQK